MNSWSGLAWSRPGSGTRPGPKAWRGPRPAQLASSQAGSTPAKQIRFHPTTAPRRQSLALLHPRYEKKKYINNKTAKFDNEAV